MRSFWAGHVKANKTMLGRRELLKALLLLAPVAVLASCTDHTPEQQRAIDERARRLEEQNRRIRRNRERRRRRR